MIQRMMVGYDIEMYIVTTEQGEKIDLREEAKKCKISIGEYEVIRGARWNSRRKNKRGRRTSK